MVDCLMDLPEVQASRRLKAAISLGDGGSLEGLRERTEGTVTCPSGSPRIGRSHHDVAPGGWVSCWFGVWQPLW
jgi:hypothetical protein